MLISIQFLFGILLIQSILPICIPIGYVRLKFLYYICHLHRPIIPYNNKKSCELCRTHRELGTEQKRDHRELIDNILQTD